MDALAIRAATADDEPAVVALWRDAGLVVPHNDPAADFRFARGGPASDVLVGTAPDGTLVGAVMVGHDGHRGWLYYLAAASHARRVGIGRALVRAAEAWLAGRGVPKAMLMVRDTNTQVLAFYERLGFAASPVVVMQRWLTPDG